MSADDDRSDSEGDDSGWRKHEILGLTWDEIDEAGGVIRLSPARSKTLVGRMLPMSQPIAEALERRRVRRDPDSPLVFHRDGIPVRRWRTAWRTAGQAAGVPTRFLHDCRRTAARNQPAPDVRRHPTWAQFWISARELGIRDAQVVFRPIPGWPPGRTWAPRRLAPREAHRRPTARDPAVAANTATPPPTAAHTATGGVRGQRWA